MEITPDQVVYWRWGVLTVNATLVWTWVVMAVLVVGSWFLTRGVGAAETPSRGQRVLEAVVELISGQIRDVSGQSPRPFLAFVGTLFLFIFTSNVISVLPGAHTPTASLSTTTALATAVFIAVPVLGIRSLGLAGYLRHFAEPSAFMLPLNVIGELSRTVALALRLFGNMMSGGVMVAIAVSLAPLFFPVLLQVFGLVIGSIQAYIFAVLATVYLAAATSTHDRTHRRDQQGVT
jgi:F-type H+-transporting ATPase subunit a